MRSVRRPRGQAAVEAAVVLPFLLILALGAVGVGRVVQARMALESVAREGARAVVLSDMPRAGSNDESAWRAAQENGENQARSVARAFHWTIDDVRFTRQPDFSPGSWVRANVEMKVPINIPFIGGLLGQRSVTLRSEHWERIDPYRSRLP